MLENIASPTVCGRAWAAIDRRSNSAAMESFAGSGGGMIGGARTGSLVGGAMAGNAYGLGSYRTMGIEAPPLHMI